MKLERVSINGLARVNICTDIIKSKKHKKKLYFAEPITFDIEVTNYKAPDETRAGIVYLWTAAVSTDYVYYGRTIEEFKYFLEVLNDQISSTGAYLVIYVHNLAYEWQFIRKYFTWDEVFLTDIRKPLYARTMSFEFRCSYHLSNMTLDNFLKNCNCEIQKLPYDYSKQRFPWDDISAEDLEYCVHDTAGLLEAVHYTMDNENNDITTIPLTSTGFVRRDVKQAEAFNLKRKIKEINEIDNNLYEALHGAFVGGNTHANRLYAGQVMTDVTCYDITSSYPYAQVSELFPMEPFREKKDLSRVKLDKHFAYLLKCEFTNIRLKSYWDGMPNISISKCEYHGKLSGDNGRILSADKIIIWMTDIELNITKNHYVYDDLIFHKVYYSRYGELPESIKACIFSYFENKSKLKFTNPYLYRKSKEKLNAIYGMSAFDIGKRRFSYNDNDYDKDDREISEILEEIERTTVQAEPYAWGVWTTAHARKNLDEVIRLAGDQFIYCDTDSVYVSGELDLSEVNRRNMKKSAPYAVHFEGKSYNLGKWVVDKKCKEFKTLGAKKYCYTDDSGVHTVTAGVSKKAGVKSISEYQLGHTFKNATNNAWYIDDEMTLSVDGHTVIIPACVYIESGDYTLGVTSDYFALLSYVTDGESETFLYE